MDKDSTPTGRRSLTAVLDWLKENEFPPAVRGSGRSKVYQLIAEKAGTHYREARCACLLAVERNSASGGRRKQIDEWFRMVMEGSVTCATVVDVYMKNLGPSDGNAHNSGVSVGSGTEGLLSAGTLLSANAARKALRTDSKKTRTFLDVLRSLLESYKVPLGELSRLDEGTYIDEISKELIAVFDGVIEDLDRHSVNGGVRKK